MGQVIRTVADRAQARPGLVLVGVWILASLIRFALVRSSAGPVVVFDEWLTQHHAAALFGGTKYQPSWTQFVYPPLYPLTLSGGMIFGPGFYRVFLGLNCLIYSAAIFPAYRLARAMMPGTLALAAAVIVVAVPFPANIRYLMAENLLVPLFLTTTALVVLGHRTGRHRWLVAALTGAAVAACYLAKFIMLPGALGFVLLWLVFSSAELISPERPGSLAAAVRILAGQGALLIGTGLCLIGLWLAYAAAQSIDLRNALGLTSSDLVFKTHIFTPFRIWTWFVLYVTYLGTILAPLLPLLIGACAVDWRQRFGAASRRPLVRKAAVLLTDPSNRLELIAVGFLSVYAAISMVHDLSYPGNAVHPQMMSSRYFEFVYPLFVILTFRRLQALVEAPRPVGTRPILVGGALASLTVLWAFEVFRMRKVFDLSVNVTATPGVHTTTFLLWFSMLLLVAWMLVPIGAAGLTYLLERRGAIRRIAGVWIGAFLVLWAASLYAWRSDGQFRVLYTANHTDIARSTGQLLFGPPSGGRTVVFHDVPGVVNWAIYGRGILDLYATFFSGTHDTFQFLDSAFYQNLTRRRARNTTLLTITRTPHAGCLGPIGRGELRHEGYQLCPCTLDPADGTALQCRFETVPLEKRYPGTLASYSTMEASKLKPVFDAAWDEAGSFGTVPPVTMVASSGTFVLPLADAASAEGLALRLRLASLQPRRIRVSLNGVALGEATVSTVFPGQWATFPVPSGLVAGGSARVGVEVLDPVGRFDLARGVLSLIELSLAKGEKP